MITDEQRKMMLNIAKPELLELSSDVFMKETALTLLKRIEKKGSGVGDTILELMWLAFKDEHGKVSR